MKGHKRLLSGPAGRGWAVLSFTLMLATPAFPAAGTRVEAEAGTGGVAVQVSAGQWPGAHASMPKVFATEAGLKIVTAQGREISVPSGNPWQDKFFTLWWKLHDPRNGYFSSYNLPYHAVETLIVEAPDHGHVTTSETFSYWAWLEAMYAHYTGDFAPLRYVYDRIDSYAVPPYQPSIQSYNPQSPATFARENSTPQAYPSPLEAQVSVGQDPLAEDLKRTYGDGAIYGMHWLLDTSNWYGFGKDDSGKSNEPVWINTFQRGPQESVWETIPHPSIEEFRFGAPNQGYLSLFIQDGSGYKRQWRYTNAPDADARLVQATWFARNVAREQGQAAAIEDLTAKASRMGDYLRYAMFDKYFKPIGCHQLTCPGGKHYESAHYLLGWYYSWGGSHPDDSAARWSWRIGSSSAHFGYQNPLAAYILSEDPEFIPRSQGGQQDWAQSLDRQLEFYQWLQSEEGAIAGGATNSWAGAYAEHPAGVSTFHGMAYEKDPVYLDPGSNSWFGWQAWSMQRVAELYALTGDARAEALLNRWVPWVMSVTRLLPDGGYEIPATLVWSGQPKSQLSVKVMDHTQDLGIASALAKTLMFHAAGRARHQGQVDHAARDLARELMERIWKHEDAKGLSVPEVRKDYHRFFDPVYVPSGFQGKMPDGSLINSSATFISLRSRYREDPDFARVENYRAGGPAPVFHYHRFWAQVEAAMAYAEFDRLFEGQ
ncbi:glycoside hydrolase family 48 protein [Oligoflexus tunisiensis]|uniref:glycoside hydrolase family 48 protein n=1 Tax=Oligoflexus tunisiensis TaxID=708132 RepID=UPI000AAD6201|nr:glycoside hydrolase family 48 protein [Oligoflexus tunisiensis]